MSPRVGGVDDAPPVAARGRVLDLECARGQQSRLPAGRRHGIEVQPAIVLRRKDDGVIAAPVELLLGAQRVENAARAFRRAVDLGHAAVGDIGDADRPGRAGAVGDEADFIRRRRQSQERDARAIRRPARFDVEGQAGIEPAQRVVGEGVDADEAVIVARADEGQATTIRRESQRADDASRIEQQFRLPAVARRSGIDLAFLEEQDARAIRRGDGRMPGAELDAARGRGSRRGRPRARLPR